MSYHSDPELTLMIEEAYIRISILELVALNMYALVLSIVILILIMSVISLLYDGCAKCIDGCKPKPPVVYGERESLMGDVEKC